MTGYFDKYAADYDRIQPVKIEMYRFYHELALSLVPFERDEAFRIADIGCGTGTFLQMLFERFPRTNGLGLDLSPQMLDAAKEKLSGLQVRFLQHDLTERLPDEIGKVDLIVAFSALHHLPDDRKRSIAGEIFSALKPGGYLFLADAMFVSYDESVWKMGREREEIARLNRLADAGVDRADYDRYEEAKNRLDASSPERDRISSLDSQLANLRDVGFSKINHVWHFWMEHLVIAQK